ncbi:hypothetical protein QOT17_007336 [Balamuthia mandrillaris]
MPCTIIDLGKTLSTKTATKVLKQVSQLLVRAHLSSSNWPSQDIEREGTIKNEFFSATFHDQQNCSKTAAMVLVII